MRQRFMFRFWLDVVKPSERDLAEYLENLKAKRQLTAAIRDGLRLIRDLRAGNLDVLCELFPWVERALMDAIEAATKSSSDNAENSESNAILSKLDALQRVIEAQKPGGHVQAPSSGPAPQMMSGNLSSLAGSKPLPPPDANDDLADMLEVKEATPSDVNATQNFINSLMALQSVKSPKSDKPRKPDYRKPLSPDAIEVRQVT